MTQKPSSLLNRVHIISDSNSTIIEFKFNPFFAPLIFFDLVLSSFGVIAVICFFPTIELERLIGMMLFLYSFSFIKHFNSHLFIKKIIIERDTIEFKYYGFSIKQELIRSPHEVNFTVKAIGEKLKIEILNNTFMLDNAHDLPIITDKISMLLNLEFIETVRLSRGKEVLVYRRK